MRFETVISPVISVLLFTASLLTGCASEDAPLTVHRFTSGAEGFDTTTYWVDTGKEVVIFDAQFTPALAQAKLEAIQEVTDSPIRYVVVTHPNPDKFNGASIFQEAGAQLVASEATAEAMPGVHAYKKAYFVGAGMFTEESYPTLPTVDVTFTDELKLDLEADLEITLVRLQHPGVSSTQTVAVLPNQQLIVGDLVAGQVHAWLEGGIVGGAPTPTLDGWKQALDEVRALGGDDATVYPGRGEEGPVSERIPAQQDYLLRMRQVVYDYLITLESPTEALTGADAGSHYAALTAQAEAAFPDYGLSYLITYGVYGLALSEAAALEAE